MTLHAVVRCAAQKLIALLIVFALVGSAIAQEEKSERVVDFGDAVVTGFSGTKAETEDRPRNKKRNDVTFIDKDGASLKVFDVGVPGGAKSAQLIDAPVKFEVKAGEIGQVFGVALDNQDPPNIYVGATSLHGLPIVVKNDDEKFERIKKGESKAQWMEGLFGEKNGGGPGSIWKIDGTTGEATLFANVEFDGNQNKGPGLGNLAFDPDHEQLYVSDLQTGLIHRFDMEGNDLGQFDHGVSALSSIGLDPVAFDPSETLDIKSKKFKPNDPKTWGFAPDDRQVWGLGYNRGRLYYAASNSAEIFSVGIEPNGSFSGDVRFEFEVAKGKDKFPVSDIAFTSSGEMLLAQRGGITAKYDYTRHHESQKTHVWRYKREEPDDPDTPSTWVEKPDEYAIGFPGERRNTAGGIAIGYGYDPESANLDIDTCEGTLWTTGDALRDDKAIKDRSSKEGALAIHGLQANALSDTREGTEPPWKSYFLNYYAGQEDDEATGHVGDVEVAQLCGGKLYDSIPEDINISFDPPKDGYFSDLKVTKIAHQYSCEKGKDCPFTIIARNVGDKPYFGPVWLRDVSMQHTTLSSYHFAPPWACWATGFNTYDCWHPNVWLAPGDAVSLNTTFVINPAFAKPVYRNCSTLSFPLAVGDDNPFNDTSCDYVAVCEAGQPNCAPDEGDLMLSKQAENFQCTPFGQCSFFVSLTNVGGKKYKGKPKFQDTFSVPGAILISHSPAADWTCSFASPITCERSEVEMFPGDAVAVKLTYQLPFFTPAGTYDNCAGTQSPAPGSNDNKDPTNDFQCDKVAFCPAGAAPGTCKPDLEITKVAESPACVKGDTCKFKVEARNVGTSDYNGPIVIKDFMYGPDMTFTAPPPGWGCVGGAGSVTCSHLGAPVHLAPGDAVTFDAVFNVKPNPAGNIANNCATLDWPGLPDVNPANDGPSCAAVPIVDVAPAAPPGAPLSDFKIKKNAVSNICSQFDSCDFDIEVINIGPDDFVGVPSFEDKVPNGLIFDGVSGLSPWSCQENGGLVTCSLTTAAGMAAGTSSNVKLKFEVDPAFGGGDITNTATVHADAEIDGNPANNTHSATVNVAVPEVAVPEPEEAQPKLVLKKSAASPTCEIGKNCRLTAAIGNDSDVPFSGKITVDDRAMIANTGKYLVGALARSDQDFCANTNKVASLFTCRGIEFDLAAGATREYFVDVKIPADGTAQHGDTLSNLVSIIVTGAQPGIELKLSAAAQATVLASDVELNPIEGEKPAVDLAITKVSAGDCRSEQNCVFRTTIENVGFGRYEREVALVDSIPDGMSFVSASKDMNCSASGNQISCTRDGAGFFFPGQKATVDLTFKAPKVERTRSFQSCARLGTGNFADAVTENNAACAATTVRIAPPVLETCPDGTLKLPGKTCPEAEDKPDDDLGSTEQPLEPEDDPPTCDKKNGLRAYRDKCVCLTGLSPTVRGTKGNILVCGDPDDSQEEPDTAGQDVKPDCLNGTLKKDSDDKWYCSCPSGYSHVAYGCKKPDSVSESKPDCTNGTLKKNSKGQWYCSCRRGWINVSYGCKKDETDSGSRPDCKNGTLKKNSRGKWYCSCPSGWSNVSYGCKQNDTSGPKPDCKNGTLKKNSRGKWYCSCPSGWSNVSYGCKKDEEVKPPCKNGTHKKSSRTGKWYCSCPDGFTNVSYGCKLSVPPVICKGGFLIGRLCACPKKHDRIKTGKNSYLCKKKADSGPKPPCKNGTLSKNSKGRWYCSCPRGYSKASYGCKKTQTTPSVTCRGGKVSLGKYCICPKGTSRVKTGKNSYYCKKKSKPPLDLDYGPTTAPRTR